MPRNPPPRFNAILFGLSGCLVDFGARTLPVALGRLLPDCPAGRLAEACALPADAALAHALGAPATTAQRELFEQHLQQAALEHSETVTDLEQLAEPEAFQGVPCAWLDELPPKTCANLATPYPPGCLAAAPSLAAPGRRPTNAGKH